MRNVLESKQRVIWEREKGAKVKGMNERRKVFEKQKSRDEKRNRKEDRKGKKEREERKKEMSK